MRALQHASCRVETRHGAHDRDGDQDLYVTTYRGGNHLFRNGGDGTFVMRFEDFLEAVFLKIEELLGRGLDSYFLTKGFWNLF